MQPSLILLAGASFISMHTAPAATRTWNGGDTVNTDWNNATNWNPNTAPVAGDTLVFPAGIAAADQATNNNFAANTVFAGLVFQTGGYSVAGNAFDLSTTGIALTSEEGGTTTITPTIRLTNHGLSLDSGPKGILRTGAVNLNGNRLMLVGSGLVDIAGNIVNPSGTPPLIKTGIGSVVLGGFNNFAADIEVNEGTLFANGFIAGAGTLTVSTVATLAGAEGGVTKTTTISGTLSPGTLTDSTKRMEFESLSFFGGPGLTKKVKLDLLGDVAGDTYDQLRINGPVGLNLPNLVLDFGTYNPPIGTVFTLIDNRSTGAISGTFTGIAQNSQSAHDGVLLRFSYTGGTGNDFTATVITDPSYNAWILSFPSLTNPADRLREADPDHDGFNNLAEFALDGDPTKGANTGKVFIKIAKISGVDSLTATLAVRSSASATFSPPGGGFGVRNLDMEPFDYIIQGSATLATFGLAITEVTGPAFFGPIQAGLPAPNPGWTYRTFRRPVAIQSAPFEIMRVRINQ